MSEDGDAVPAMDARLLRLKVLALAILVCGLAADLATKAWMERLLDMDPTQREPARRIEVIEGFFALEGTYNPGVTFGLAQGKTVPILVFTVLATVGLAAWLTLTRHGSRTLHVGLGMVLAGALGNLHDRWLWTRVRDFLLFYAGDWKWPNFNLADSLIVVGVGLIFWYELIGRRGRRPPVPSS